MEPLSAPADGTTFCLHIPDDRLAAAPGVGSYVYHPQTKSLTASGVAPAGIALQFYVVQPIGDEGSWWVPTAKQSLVPPNWPNPIAIPATGPGIQKHVGGEPILIASGVVWWVPQEAQTATGIVPGVARGSLLGDYPQVSPAGVSS